MNIVEVPTDKSSCTVCLLNQAKIKGGEGICAALASGVDFSINIEACLVAYLLNKQGSPVKTLGGLLAHFSELQNG